MRGNVARQSPSSPSDEHGINPVCEREDRRAMTSARPDRDGRRVQARTAVPLGFTSTRDGISTPPPNPRNRANLHWRWRAYHTCRARSLVRLARVASIVGAPSERDAGPPATRRSRLRPTLTRGIAGAAENPASRARSFFETGSDARVWRVASGEPAPDFFRDGLRRSASRSRDGTVRLRRPAGPSREEVLVLCAAGGPVRRLRFSPDGRLLGVLVQNETAVRIW